MEVDEEMKSDEMPTCVKTLLEDGPSVAEWLSSIIMLKNTVIGSNREKWLTVHYGLVPRLLSWVEKDSCLLELRTEAAIVLGSLAKGGVDTVQRLVDAKGVQILLKSLNSSNLRYTEAILRCLRSIFLHNTESVECLYEESSFGSSYIPHLLELIQLTPVCQECVTTILQHACKTREHQMCLLRSNALTILTPLLASPSYRIQMPALCCFANMCYKNVAVCKAVITEKKLVDMFVRLMGRDKPSKMQLAAAQVLTYLHRGGAISANDFVISRKTLGTLVRMCRQDQTMEENIKGAQTLAYLVEIDPELQAVASITDHLISTLSTYLHYQDAKKLEEKEEPQGCNEMKSAAFLAFASISANDEEIRAKVIKQEGMMGHLQTSLKSSSEEEVAASLRCLQSLTRSVQQIRTVLRDSAVWRPLLEKVRSTNHEIMVLAMTCLCNLMLEFSPSKEDLARFNAVEVLCELCHSDDNVIRLNATWAVMSMSYCAPEELRLNIINQLGTETIVKRLEDPVLLIREKALALVRNLLTHKSSIDNTVKLLGNLVMESVFRVVKDNNMPTNIVEQALCVLSNMADGPICKTYIISKTDEITSVVKFLQFPEPRLQLPAIQFVSNLVETSDDGSYQRMQELKKLDVQVLLESLVGTSLDDVDKRLESSTLEALLIAKSRPGNAGDRDYSKEELSELKSAYHRSLKN